MTEQALLSQVSVDGVIGIGIDVAKDSLVVGLWRREAPTVTLSLGNTETDITTLGQCLSGYGGRIVLESTGSYHLRSAVVLSEMGYDLRVINPILATKYTKASVRKVKTDKKDALCLAEMAYKEERLPTPFSPEREELLIKKRLSLIASLNREVQSLEAILSSYRETVQALGGEFNEAEKAIEESIQTLKEKRKGLEKEVTGFGETLSIERQQAIERLTTIPGITRYVATIASIHFKQRECAKQWVAYAGLDVSVRQSGQWKGRGKLTKRGNAYLRKRLFSAAWGAVMHDDEFHAYYTRLKQQGRHHYEALNIIARKLIRIMFVLTKNETNYDPEKLHLPGGNT